MAEPRAQPFSVLVLPLAAGTGEAAHQCCIPSSPNATSPYLAVFQLHVLLLPAFEKEMEVEWVE